MARTAKQTLMVGMLILTKPMYKLKSLISRPTPTTVPMTVLSLKRTVFLWNSGAPAAFVVQLPFRASNLSTIAVVVAIS